ncbi:MAG: hypothetical protein HUJ76_04850 [Parasporobacterium sp.]|nr:hypothetical protein [Parasporobacterium sp.]
MFLMKKDKVKKDKKKKPAKKAESSKARSKLKRVDVSSIIPFSFDSEKMMFVDDDGNYIMMVRTVGTNLFQFKDDAKMSYLNGYKHVFSRSIGNGQIFSFQVGADVDKYIRDYQYFIDGLDRRNEQDMIKYQILKDAQTRLKQVSATKELVDREFLFILKDKNISRLESRCREIIGAIGTFQRTEILDFTDTYNVLFCYYHPINSKLFFEAKKEMLDSGVMDYLYPTRLGSVDTGFKQSIELDDTFCRIKYVSDYKKQPVFALMSYLATAADIEFSMHFMPAEQDVIIKELDKDLRNERKNLDNAKEESQRTAVRNEIENKAALQEKMVADNDTPFYFATFLRIKGDSIAQVNAISRELDKVFASEGIRFRDGVFEPFDLFNYCAPICHDVPDRFFKASTTDTLALMYPFIFEALYDSVPLRETPQVSTPPVYIGNTLQTNGVVFYDSFTAQGDRSNYNEFIVGASGMGKTFFMMWLIYSRFALGYKQFIIDVEGKELNKLTHYLGGVNIDCSSTKSGRMNPLQIRFNIPESDDGDATVPLKDIYPLSNHLRFLRTFLSVYKGISAKDDDPRMGIIESVLQGIYKDMGITLDTDAQYIKDNFRNEDYPVMKDVYDRIEAMIEEERNSEMPDVEQISLLKRCRLFIESLAVGADSALFNGHTNVNLDNPLINFNVSSLQDNTGSSVLMAEYYNVLSYIWTEIISDGNRYRKQLYADEFSIIMDKRCESIMMYFQSIVKRVRKYYCGFTSATQQISDVLKDSVKEEGEAIVNNSSYKFFFGLGSSGIQFFNGSTIIPDTEKEFVQFANIGECYAQIGNSTALRVKITLDDDVFDLFERIKK